jgi:hypothetical protein
VGAALLLGACASTPKLTGNALPTGVLAALDFGDAESAQRLLENASSEDKEHAYPVLFGAAREHYEAGEYSKSVGVLRVLKNVYPDGAAVREAYAYGLFLERATLEEPTPEMIEELEESVEAIAALGVRPPTWVHLIEAQTAIDRGRTDAALAALETFHTHWDGQPAALQLYVADLERYIASH